MYKDRSSEDECRVWYDVCLVHSRDDRLYAEAFWITCTKLIEAWTDGYVWNDEPFRLEFPREADKETGRYEMLSGSTCFGDCVEDEWFITKLLFRLCDTFPDDIFVRAKDDDGQFLLIEAAEALPEWLSPETAKDRIVVFKGALHIISPEIINDSPKLHDVRRILSSSDTMMSTRASDAIQKIILQRLDTVRPKRWIHRAWCVIPIKVAESIEKYPEIISHAVNAFHRRDSADIRAASKLRMTLGSRPHSKDRTGKRCKCRRACLVRFSRSLYAKLRAERFEPPRGFEDYVPKSEHQAHRACALGLRLCGALEVLASRCTKKSELDDARNKILGLDSKTGNVDAAQRKLPESVGKIVTTEFGQRAIDIGAWGQTYFEGKRDTHCSQSFAALARASLTTKTRDDQCRKTECVDDYDSQRLEDDCDRWMTLAPESVDAMLRKYDFDADALSKEILESDADKQNESTLSSSTFRKKKSFVADVASAMHRFVNFQDATIDGAEVPIEPKISVREDTRPSAKEDDASRDVSVDEDVLMRILSGGVDIDDARRRDVKDEDGVAANIAGSRASATSHCPTLHAGDEATICELKNKRSYNGKKCRVLRWLGDKKGRYAVKMLSQPYVSLSVRPRNLKCIVSTKTTETFMTQMDNELKGTAVDKSFGGAALQHMSSRSGADTTGEDDAASDDIELNVNMNLVRSMMASFEMQHGLPGPASNVLGGMGLSIPGNDGGERK
eukprot:g2584.t1